MNIFFWIFFLIVGFEPFPNPPAKIVPLDLQPLVEEYQKPVTANVISPGDKKRWASR